VYPTTSQSVSRPEERRRNPRLRSSSLIYVQLGSDNGGIVTNLGVDGVAFQAARRLTEESNSTLNLRLRGSGLNANLTGELVWLGATKKEAGICFKEIPPEVHQGITEWIARETQTGTAPAAADRGRPKQMPAMTGASAAGEKSGSHSFSAALAMSQAGPRDLIPERAEASNTKPSVRAPLDSPAVISATPPEIVSLIERSAISNIPSEGDLQSQKLDLSSPQNRASLPAEDRIAPPQQSELELPSKKLLLPPTTAIERPFQSAEVNPHSLVPFRASKAPSPEEVLQASKQEAVEESEPPTIETESKENDAKPDALASSAASFTGQSVAADKWIPPALLAAWRRGNSEEKWALAGLAAGCFCIFGLILVWAVMHVASPSSASAGGGSLQQSQARLGAPATETASAQAVLSQDDQPIATNEAEDVQPPPPTLLGEFADFIFGTKPVKTIELWRRPQVKIDPSLVGVQVWTSKDSGYYYCTDSPFYMTLQPGIIMNQRDALQSGYQPILGGFCN